MAKERKLVFLMSIITIMVVFLNSLGGPLLLGFFAPFHIQVIIILAKIKKSISFSARFEHTIMES